MSKNIVIVIIIGIVLVGAFFVFKGKGPIDTALFGKDEAGLAAFGNDIASFDQDDAVLDELDQTFNDILDESAVLSVESALDLASIETEASLADFSGDLDVFSEAVLQEVSQALGEASQ